MPKGIKVFQCKCGKCGSCVRPAAEVFGKTLLGGGLGAGAFLGLSFLYVMLLEVMNVKNQMFSMFSPFSPSPSPMAPTNSSNSSAPCETPTPSQTAQDPRFWMECAAAFTTAAAATLLAIYLRSRRLSVQEYRAIGSESEEPTESMGRQCATAGVTYTVAGLVGGAIATLGSWGFCMLYCTIFNALSNASDSHHTPPTNSSIPCITSGDDAQGHISEAQIFAEISAKVILTLALVAYVRHQRSSDDDFEKVASERDSLIAPSLGD